MANEWIPIATPASKAATVGPNELKNFDKIGRIDARGIAPAGDLPLSHDLESGPSVP
jgi:hypothetical protein